MAVARLSARDTVTELAAKKFRSSQSLHLTPDTMDSRFISDWGKSSDKSLGGFILQVVTQSQISPGFPLRIAPKGFLPERLFLTDRERWKLTTP
jgi:hypothetical protein